VPQLFNYAFLEIMKYLFLFNINIYLEEHMRKTLYTGTLVAGDN